MLPDNRLSPPFPQCFIEPLIVLATLGICVIPFASAVVDFMGVKAGFDSSKGEVMLFGIAFLVFTAVISKRF
ncbi:hypothetical protein BCS98_07575 [Vibrio breoganii]|nr:hypothetical protein A1QG_17470 [Vibrio breoganii ZF-29]OEF82239.1 hypothetical protein B003_11280 [Vibrio breoganii 1C10]PMG08817.1 hypothetical protein BCV00_05440 [Vibrio breoganii]PMM88610.1 hypothetical protein BCT45_18255 [Vibrio breoganii]PMO85701.1 hypothetical protein BCT00_01905 [Vibrio breoganii]